MGMYDSLDKIGLKAVLAAIKEKIPTSLPANGGNADTVGGKAPEKIFYDNGVSNDFNGATQSGCYAASPDTLNVPFPAWWLVDTMNFNNQFIVQKAHLIGSSTNTMSYIRNYANDVWSEWKEISTTPIKSEILSASTDESGNAMIYTESENKKIISINSFAIQAVPFNYNNNQYGHFFENNGTPYVGSASFCAYYIEG